MLLESDPSLAAVAGARRATPTTVRALRSQNAAQLNIRYWWPTTSSPLRILAVVAHREGWQHALVAPDAIAAPPGITACVLVAIGRLAIDCGARRFERRVIAIVD